MKYTASIQKTLDLKNYIDMEEVLITPSRLSRFGQLNFIETSELAKKIKEQGKKCVLVFDVLIIESDFDTYIKLMEKFLATDLFASIRVQDTGVLEYVLEHTTLPIQFITETGNHNLLALKTWEEYIGVRLERFCISKELSLDELTQLKNNLNTPLELLGLGRILIFYTPRMLLSPYLKEELEHIEIFGDSEESPHKDFPILQNVNGTFMFLDKWISLLEHKEKLEEIGVDYLRIELDQITKVDALDLYNSFLQSEIDYQKFKESFPRKLIHGFLVTNKSDVLFKKLKNSKIKRRDADYIGNIVGVEKDRCLGILLRNPKLDLSNEQKLIIETPEGKTKRIDLKWLKDSGMKDTNIKKSGDLVFIDYISGVSVRSSVYLQQ